MLVPAEFEAVPSVTNPDILDDACAFPARFRAESLTCYHEHCYDCHGYVIGVHADVVEREDDGVRGHSRPIVLHPRCDGWRRIDPIGS